MVENAEDNDYPSGATPALEFVITSKDITCSGATATLLVFNNENGFTQANIESICRIGKSTKRGNRSSGYIGEKGTSMLFLAENFKLKPFSLLFSQSLIVFGRKF